MSRTRRNRKENMLGILQADLCQIDLKVNLNYHFAKAKSKQKGQSSLHKYRVGAGLLR